jgi:hypothetical protein
VGSSAILDSARLTAAPIAAVVAGSAVRRGRTPPSSAASASEGASVGASVAVLVTCSAVLVLLVLREDCDGGAARLTPFSLPLRAGHPADLAGRRQLLQQVQRHLGIYVSVRVDWIRCPASPESLFNSFLSTSNSAYELNAILDDCRAEFLLK